MATVRVRAGHVQPLWAGHPWVYAQAISNVEGAPRRGDVVRVVDPEGKLLGKGFWSERSAIPVKLLTRLEEDALDEAFLVRRLEEASAWRKRLLDLPNATTSAFRLAHAEGDGLAGLVVDVYGQTAIVQLLTAGMKQREDAVFAAVAKVTAARTVIEAKGGRSQQLEGIETESRVVRGVDVRELHFVERGFEFALDACVAQKTGYYLDQRDNRALVERFAHGRTVLDAFCYVGAFGLAALRGGATHVTAVDSSAPALAIGATLAERNGFGGKIAFERADVKRALPAMQEEKKQFDLIILDPPKLAPTTRNVDAAKKAYRRLNANAMRLLSPDGVLVSCSCSAGVKDAEFSRILALAASDARREISVLATGHQGADHPVPAAFPEGRYLKCAVVRAR